MSTAALTDHNAARHCRWPLPCDGIARVAAAHRPSENAYSSSREPQSNRAATYLAYRTDPARTTRLHPSGIINHRGPAKSP